jgi:hypothetical protein
VEVLVIQQFNPGCNPICFHPNPMWFFLHRRLLESHFEFCRRHDKAPDMGGGNVGAAFTAKLKQIGTRLTSEDLLKLYPADATTNEGEAPLVLEECKFFDLFDADPAKVRKETERLREEVRQQNGVLHLNQILMSPRHHPLKRMQTFDYRLKPAEKAKLAANGVVAVERLSGESFADIYYHMYTDDMPVFVTSDSVLHAWHRSFDAFLVDVETKTLSSTLDRVLDSSLSKCHDAIAAASGHNTSETNAMLDVELFLRMALSLLRGEELPGSGSTTQKLGPLWLCVQAEETTQAEVFSSKRAVDFSMFKPRGHYAKSEALKRYFRATTWLGTIDFRVAGGENPVEDLHQLHCAVVLVRLLLESQSLEAVENVDSLVSKLVADGGVGADSLSPSELARLISSEDKAHADDNIATTRMLEGLQARILQRGLGTQLVNGHPRMENLPATSSAPMAPPTAFALLGQRFVWSSFVFSRVVFDQVVHKDEKQKRRMPSAVDVAFALFGNDSAARVLAARMDAKPPKVAAFGSSFVPFRDGIPFASNLVALRQLMDQELGGDTGSATGEATSISTLWQRALRALSRPSPNAARTFHSHVWQQRQMNTQLGSFTQLRHDTLLYAKQSFTMLCGCEYAAGLVDPYPLFWRRMQELANGLANTIEGELKRLLEFCSESDRRNNSLARRSEGFFRSFAETMQTIEEIAVCQADKTPLSELQTSFLKTVMEERFGSGGSRYCGWYPGLFFESREDSSKSDVIVADAHTDCASTVHRDPGGVLHLGVGNPLMGFFVVDNVMYAGPVFSSYEFVTRIDQRLTDAEFERKLPSIRMPQWAYQTYLA